MRIASLAIVCSLAVACAPKALVRGSPYKGDPLVVGLAPPVLLHEVPGVVQEDVFLENLFVGNVVFSGGFEVVRADGGLQNRSLHIDLDLQEPYAREIRAMVEDWMIAALDRQKITWQRLDALPDESLPVPQRRDLRGSYDLEGRDNQNMPVALFNPTALRAVPALPDGIDAVLVPMVVYYYSHNGGWFQGQTWGTHTGARIRVLWSLHDAGGGRLLAWGDHETRQILKSVSSPNSSQLQDTLMEAEADMARSLAKAKLR